jgi:hypothetical protein
VPPLVLVTTPGAPDANAYADRAAAAGVLAAVLDAAAWDEAGDDQARALAAATARLDQCAWQGTATAFDQPLAFPRQGLRDADGRAVPATVIPRWLVQATALLALALLRRRSDGEAAEASAATANALAAFKVVKIGSLEVQPAQQPAGAREAAAAAAGALPADVRRLIGPYLRGASTTVRVVRA